MLNEITAGHLRPAQLKQVLAIGWEVDSHSVNHPDLTTLSPAELRYQVVASRRFLQRTLRIPADSFCYPSSEYDSAVIAAVRAAGYSNATTENGGYASRDRPFERTAAQSLLTRPSGQKLRKAWPTMARRSTIPPPRVPRWPAGSSLATKYSPAGRR